eukprot:gnl/MRDRNA2_/MRDRNA2_174592_c0_seq1.p2 gnl/MRDRNA2_/MRDRNA2_174592_c0~~gnl/MRDRNA2_/MRDRNA2_174592_c0_seq1.p2  ORF type:complete len:180 (-),score=25.16 gnl/MRDRNA2_/MRDRNA2_174592_c0_seq1:607-1104(-)
MANAGQNLPAPKARFRVSMGFPQLGEVLVEANGTLIPRKAAMWMLEFRQLLPLIWNWQPRSIFRIGPAGHSERLSFERRLDPQKLKGQDLQSVAPVHDCQESFFTTSTRLGRFLCSTTESPACIVLNTGLTHSTIWQWPYRIDTKRQLAKALENQSHAAWIFNIE